MASHPCEIVAVPRKFTEDVKVIVDYIDDWNLQVADGDVKRAHSAVKYMLKESTWDMKPIEPKSESETPAGKINARLEKLTAKQALEIDDLTEQVEKMDLAFQQIAYNLVGVGGPLNDNKDCFNVQQQQVCFRILELCKQFHKG